MIGSKKCSCRAVQLEHIIMKPWSTGKSVSGVLSKGRLHCFVVLVQHTQQCMIMVVVSQGWPQNLETLVVVGMQPSAYSLEFFERYAHALGTSVHFTSIVQPSISGK